MSYKADEVKNTGAYIKYVRIFLSALQRRKSQFSKF